MKKVLIYCRESRDDGFINYERIETQAKMLESFCEKENLGEIVKIVMDDNKSGTNFDRLIPIRNMIINKEFDIFLCKDCSRIGRNLLESLKFIEFLELHNIELLFLSETYDEDIFPIKAWFNQLRAKDDSKKIKDVIHQKMLQGTLLIHAPYGYTKNGNLLEINIDTAPIVSMIFDMFNDGFSKTYIANKLNQENIKTPSMLKNQYKNKSLMWTNNHIDRILRHMAYTGDMPYSTKTKKSYNSKVYTKKDEKDWIIIKKHHEPIISHEIFLNTQKKLKKNTIVKSRNTTENIFSGLLFCGKCGSKMYKKTRLEKSFFICANNNKFGNKVCTSHKIYETDLINLINNYIKTKLSNDNVKKLISNFYINEFLENEDISNIDDNINKLRQNLSTLYDDKINNKIPEFLYIEKLKEYENKLSYYMSEQDNIKKIKDNIDVTQFIITQKLTHEKLKLLFEKIVIFEKGDPSEFETLTNDGGILFI